MPKLSSLLAVALLSLDLASVAQAPKTTASNSQRADTAAFTPWLFAGFKGNSEDGVYYALSPDGYHWTLANGGKPVVHQTESNDLMRAPFPHPGPAGTFHMARTRGRPTPPVIGHSTSTHPL